MKKLYTLLSVLLCSCTMYGATIAVTSANDSGPGTLRDAVLNSSNGDNIDLSALAGVTITLNSPIAINTNLTIFGPVSNDLWLDGNLTNRIFEVGNVSVSMNSLIFTNGMASHGGAILNSGGTLVLSTCTFLANVSYATSNNHGGGAIYNDTGSELLISDCNFEQNFSEREVLSSISEVHGGAIYHKGSVMQITHSYFGTNYATFDGGATLDGKAYGGAIYQLTPCEIVNSSFYANSANVLDVDPLGAADIAYGGAIASYSNSTFGSTTISHSTFSDNYVDYQGPAQTGVRGGNIWNNDGDMILLSTILYGGTSNGMSDDMYSTGSATASSAGGNLFGSWSNSGIALQLTDNTGNPMLQPATNYNVNYTKVLPLSCNSPALDAGVSTVGTPSDDQIHQPRIFGSGIDVGAFELNTSPPTVTANTTSSVVCEGNSVTLTGSGAVSYTWDNGVTDGAAFSPTSTTTYTVTGTDGNGCSNTDQITITVNTLPTVTANTSSTAVCEGNSVTLTGSGAVSYTWDNGVTDGAAFSPTSTTTYTVTGTDGNGCQNADQVIITVNVLPTVTANATATSICAGSSVTLSGSGAVSYSWDNGVTNGVSFSPTSTTTYTVTGTDGNGCTDIDQITIAVDPAPTVTANATSTSICAGSSVTLSGSGAVSYSWDNGVTDGVSFSPTSTTTYTVTGTDGNGCTDTDQITIAVDPAPTVTANATSTSICAGSSVTLSGSGAVSYTWDNGVTDGVAFSPTSTTAYTVTGTDGNGCSNTDQVVVNVNPLPTVSAGADQTICSGSTVTLSGSGASTYVWNNGVTDGVPFVPTSTTTYTVTGTDGNGCQNTDQVIITVNVLPTVTANATATAICEGGSLTLTGGGAVSYIWDNGVTDGMAFSPTTTATYTVTGTDGNGCENTDQIQIIVNPLPTPTINQTGFDLMVSQTYNAYQWYLNGTLLSGETNQMISPAQNGIYAVEVTNSNGCMGSADFNVTFLGIYESPNSFCMVQVYPNPTSGELSFSVDADVEQINIYTMTGKLVQTETNPSNTISVAQLSPGIYLISIHTSKGVYTSKFIKE